MNTDVSRPEMILFDYGDTLVWEPVPDFPRGWRAVFQYVTENPDGVTPEQAHQLADGLWRRFSASRSLSASRKGGWEIHEWQQLRTVLEALDLRASLPLSELECVLMDNACQSHLFPHVEETLDSLRRLGIRTGVISNIGWSGQALARRLDKLLPGHSFEFVIASSEYGIRKPDPLIFQIALKQGRAVRGVGSKFRRGSAGRRGLPLSQNNRLAGIGLYDRSSKFFIKEQVKWEKPSQKKFWKAILSPAR